MSNSIVNENARLDGRTDRDYWDASISDQIEGFATDFSVNAGQTIDFKINVNGVSSDTLPYKIEIFRLGYYGGVGAREVAEIANADGTVQTEALFDESRGLVDAGNWLVSDSWDVPADAVSGVYLARLQRLDLDGDPIDGATNQIPFIVRNDGVPADIVLQTSDTTWHAYNGWAGNNGKVGPNFYGDPADMVDHDSVPNPGLGAQDRAYAVSYNRPFLTRDGGGAASGAQDYLFGADYAAISWLEKNGYNTSYISGQDTDRLGADYLQNYKAFISVGHDEYWSGDQRANVEAARDAGVNVLFWSGNEVYWKTRWETSISADGTEYRTLVCYKETWANGDPNAAPEDYANIDPTDIWTGTWRDVRFLASKDADGNYIAGGADPDPISGLYPNCHCAETTLTGQLFGPDGTGEFGGALDVPVRYGALRVWRNTEASDGVDDLAPGLLGYEWDLAPDDENRPAGLIKLSESTINWGAILVDQGNRTEAGTATHNLTLYRAPSGALVFASGTVFWSWGLSNEHDGSPYGADIESAAIKQMAVNLFADMGIQPETLEASLVAATRTTDFAPASAIIDDVADEVSARSGVLITGSATDTGGAVALVELSFDNGATWKVASGTTDWSYVWRPVAEGEYTIKARAIDDSLNVYNALADNELVTVTAAVTPGGVSLFDPAAPLTVSTFSEGQETEVGMRFGVNRAGEVTQLRYFRNANDSVDTDVRDGHLWRASDGTLLATVTFTSAPGESGWQYATLSNPVTLTTGVEYITSYKTADNYVASGGFFAPTNEETFDGIDNDAFTDPYGIISAPQDATGTGNGVFRYGGDLAMPTSTYGASNYWVDVTFAPADAIGNTPPVVTSGDLTVAENQTAVGTITATDDDGDALAYSIVSGADAALFQIDAATGALSFKALPNFEAPGDAGGDNIYSVTVGAADGRSDPVTKAIAIRVIDVAEPGGSGSSLFEGAPTGFISGASDSTNYELGTKFMSSEDGSIGQLRYYRGAADADDTDVRTLRLWGPDGAVLGSVTLTSTANQTGWQTGTLATPITIAAGQTYIVSYGYISDNGDGAVESYAASSGYFTISRSSADGVLTAPASGAPSGPSSGGIGNGLFSVGTSAALPTLSFNAANYWVDVVFRDADELNAPPTGTATAVLPDGVEDAAYVVSRANLLAGFSDPDGDALAVANLAASQGSVTDNGDSTFTISTVANYNGAVTLGFTVTDGMGGSIAASQSFTLAAVNDAPTGNATAVLPGGTEDVVYTVSRAQLLAGFADIDGDTLSVADLDASHGTVVDNGDGSYWVMPAANYNGAVTLGFTVTDGMGGSIAASQSFMLAAVNDAPDGLTLAGGSVAENAATGTIVGTVRGQDPDDGDSSRFALTDSAGGRFTINATTGQIAVVNGSLLDFEKATSHQIKVKVTDGSGSSYEGARVVQLSNVVEAQTLNGTSAANTLVAKSDDNYTVTGLGGNDTIATLGGADVVRGGAGDDVISTGGGDDVITFGAAEGFDRIDGGSGSNQINALANGTTIGLRSLLNVATVSANGFSGVTVLGSTGADTLDFTTVTFQGIGAIDGGAGDDALAGSAVADVIIGNGGNDMLAGGGGDDIFRVGPNGGADRIEGGEGTDSIVATAASVVIGLAGLVGIEAISANGFSGVTIAGTVGADVLNFTGVGLTGIVRISGGNGADTITGSSGNDLIAGGAGDDVLNGGGGNDIFELGSAAGSDRIDGGSGTDTINVLSSGAGAIFIWPNITDIEVVTGTKLKVSGTAGNDLLDLSAVTMTGVDKINAGAGDDSVIGTSGNDVIGFSEGRDMLTGGAGADIFDLDSLVESRTGALADTVLDFMQGTDKISLKDIDASTKMSGDQKFAFIGTAAFTGAAGQLRVDHLTSGSTTVYGDVNGDRIAEFQIEFVTYLTLQASDFNL